MGAYGYDPTPVTSRLNADDSDSVVARRFGVCRETVNRWRNRRTGIQPAIAERIAGLMGFHPAELWGREWRG